MERRWRSSQAMAMRGPSPLRSCWPSSPRTGAACPGGCGRWRCLRRRTPAMWRWPRFRAWPTGWARAVNAGAVCQNVRPSRVFRPAKDVQGASADRPWAAVTGGRGGTACHDAVWAGGGGVAGNAGSGVRCGGVRRHRAADYRSAGFTPDRIEAGLSGFQLPVADPVADPVAGARAAAGSGPLALVSCDNIAGNGGVLRAVVRGMAGRVAFVGRWWTASCPRRPMTTGRKWGCVWPGQCRPGAGRGVPPMGDRG